MEILVLSGILRHFRDGKLLKTWICYLEKNPQINTCRGKAYILNELPQNTPVDHAGPTHDTDTNCIKGFN